MKYTNFALVLLCLLFVSQAYRQTLAGSKYEKQSAQKKFEIVKQKIDATLNSHKNWYGALKTGQLFVQNNEKSFSSESDDMPYGALKFTKRDKVIHTVGSTAEFQYVSNHRHNFTGIFTGGSNGILRMSPGGKPDDGVISPAWAFKLFRNRRISANFFCMATPLGFTDSNIFDYDTSTHIPNINQNAPTQFKLVDKTFRKVSDWPNFIGLSNAAQFDEHGLEYQKPNFPFRLQLHAPKAVRDAFPKNLTVDEYYYLNMLQGKKFDVLFEVWAQATPYSEELIPIGHIKQTTPFSTSKWADDVLFFKHGSFDYDLKIKPEWEFAAEQIQEKQAQTIPQFIYPNVQDLNEVLEL